MHKFLTFLYVFMRLASIFNATVVTTTEKEEYYCDCSIEKSVLVSFLDEQKHVRSLLEDLRAAFKNELNILKSSLHAIHVKQETQILKLNALNRTFNTTLATRQKTQSISELSTVLPTSCAGKTGINTIKLEKIFPEPFEVACEHEIQGGNWTVIQRRQDGSVNFDRKWNEYKAGFGNLTGEFWLGLDKIHALTTSAPQELIIVIEDFDNKTVYAKYDAFEIGNETEAYMLKVVGNYTGDAGDSLTYHKGMKFSTKDVDNDELYGLNCAWNYCAAWWYKACFESNLNGPYLREELSKNTFEGIIWNTFHINYSLKFVVIMIRPKCR